jgi:acid phosphatase class B
VLFFGDSDSDIQEAKQAHVFPIRVKRSKHSIFKEDYNPGAFHELVIPLSEY